LTEGIVLPARLVVERAKPHTHPRRLRFHRERLFQTVDRLVERDGAVGRANEAGKADEGGRRVRVTLHRVTVDVGGAGVVEESKPVDVGC